MPSPVAMRLDRYEIPNEVLSGSFRIIQPASVRVCGEAVLGFGCAFAAYPAHIIAGQQDDKG